MGLGDTILSLHIISIFVFIFSLYINSHTLMWVYINQDLVNIILDKIFIYT